MTTANPALFCLHCGGPIPAGSAFCSRCGTPVAAAEPIPLRPCPRCGAPSDPTTAFCRQCGTRLPDPAATVVPPAFFPTTPVQSAPVQSTPVRSAPAPAGSVPAGAPAPAWGTAPTVGTPPTVGAPPVWGTQPGWGTPPTVGGPPGATGWSTPPPSAGMATGAGQPSPRGPRRGRTPVFAVVGAILVVLVVIGSVAARVSHGPSPRCVYACAPQTGVAEPNGHVYVSPDGFSFAYPGGWSRVAVSGFLAGFQEDSGQAEFLISGGSGTPSLASLLDSGEKTLAASFQQLSAVGALPGAEMGSVPGAGAMYAGIASVDGQQIPSRAAIIVAEYGGHWATLIGAGPVSSQLAPTGIEDGAALDDVLTQWSWSAS